MKRIYLLLVFSILLITSSCKRELPESKASFEGVWYSNNYETVTIRSDGYGSYVYDDGFLQKSISGKVKFKGSDLIIKYMVFKKEFQITSAPKIIETPYLTYKAMELDGELFISEDL